MEAWRLTLRAISRGTYYSGEEFDKLPPLVRQVVGGPENIHRWAGMEERLVQNNVAPWFMRAYNRKVEKERAACLRLPGSGPFLEEGGAGTAVLLIPVLCVFPALLLSFGGRKKRENRRRCRCLRGGNRECSERMPRWR